MKSVVSKKAFTIVELLVAMGLVVILVALSSLIFAAGVKAHRLADSTIEITRRAEAVSRQLVADVGGLRTDAPLAFWFDYADTTGDGLHDTRFDQILLFANGDFQTIKQYGAPPKTVWGNVSRIQYGHARQVDIVTPATLSDYLTSGLLSRRAHVLTSDGDLPNLSLLPGYSYPTHPDPSAFTGGGFNLQLNNILEYDQLTLTDWQNLVSDSNNCDRHLRDCFIETGTLSPLTVGRPIIDMQNADWLHLLLSEQVGQFKVQWAYTAEDLSSSATSHVPILPTSSDYFQGVRWWPSEKPAGDGTVTSDFVTMERTAFGAHFQFSGGTTLAAWMRVKPQPGETAAQQQKRRCMTRSGSATNYYFMSDFFPKALKFTFTVYDAKGLYPEGRTFTQIVMID